MDLSKEAAALASAIPQGAHLLDVGGGDGEPLNYLLALRPDLHVTTLDTGSAVGQWLEARFAAQVKRLPGMSLADYIAAGQADPDVVLIADVLHHVPEAARPALLADIARLLERVPTLRIIVKDVEPSGWRARLGYWSDRYITGDRHVAPISRASLLGLLGATLGPLRHEHTDLFEVDRPNYAIAFYR